MRFCPKCKEELLIKIIDNKDRLCCPDSNCRYIYWNNPIPVVGIIVETEKGIILAHNKLAPKGVFSIITGFLEADESIEKAAQRETKEELGLIALETNFLGVFPFAKANQIIIGFHVIAKGDIKLNEELDEVKIVQREDLYGYQVNKQFEVEKWLNRLNVLA